MTSMNSMLGDIPHLRIRQSIVVRSMYEHEKVTRQHAGHRLAAMVPTLLASLWSKSRYRRRRFMGIVVPLVVALIAVVVPACDRSDSAGTAVPADPPSEIWQWALGRNVWTDPALQPYSRNLGMDSYHLEISVQSQGFRLIPDDVGNVSMVRLVNDEAKLGYNWGGTPFKAYQGQLPDGLSWNYTAGDLGVDCSAPGVSCLMGAEQQRYTRDGSYRLRIVFAVTSQNLDQLPYAPMLSIDVTRA